ncbi:hypothetical protein TSUD_42300 [Trifolium subterraneum]|uniref:Uncharacterized protein n=2 Tax=Trifolium TaxID=3898 RepID=A0A2Z6LHE0_TRISU|nr:hypothetical protein TSUD_42300 [Trifolium subterraneum]
MATQLSDVNYVTTLQARVKELEAENANLSSQLAHCQCSEKVTELKKSKRKSEETIEKKPVTLEGFEVDEEGHTNNSLKRHYVSHSEDSTLFRTKKRMKKFVEGDNIMREIAKTFKKMVDVFEISCAELIKQTKKNADVENLWAQLEDIGVKYPSLPQVYIYLAQHPDALKAFNGLPIDVRLKVLPSIVPRYLLNPDFLDDLKKGIVI